MNASDWVLVGIAFPITVALFLIWWQSKQIANRLQNSTFQQNVVNPQHVSRSRRSDWLIFGWFFIGAIAIIATLFSPLAKSDAVGSGDTTISTLAIFITFLVAWQIWQTVNTNRIVDRFDERIRNTENILSNIGGLMQSQNGLYEAQRIIFNILNDQNRERAHEYAMAYLHSCDSLLQLTINQLNVEEMIDNCLTVMGRILINAQGILDDERISLDVRTRLHREFNELNPMISNFVSAIMGKDNNVHSQQLNDLKQRREDILRWTPPTSNNPQPTES